MRQTKICICWQTSVVNLSLSNRWHKGNWIKISTQGYYMRQIIIFNQKNIYIRNSITPGQNYEKRNFVVGYFVVINFCEYFPQKNFAVSAFRYACNIYRSAYFSTCAIFNIWTIQVRPSVIITLLFSTIHQTCVSLYWGHISKGYIC